MKAVTAVSLFTHIFLPNLPSTIGIWVQTYQFINTVGESIFVDNHVHHAAGEHCSCLDSSLATSKSIFVPKSWHGHNCYNANRPEPTVGVQGSGKGD